MSARFLGSALLAGLPCTIGSGIAGDVGADAPLLTRDHHPIVVLYGVPPPERAVPLPGGQRELRLTLDIANHSIEEREGEEAILLDGETYRTTLSLRAGLGRGWEIGLDVPYMHMREAVFDGRIDDWHDLLGIRTPNRDDFDVERLVFRYANGDGEPLVVSEASEGPGDLRVSLARTWANAASGRAALRAGLQLPSGDASRLHGLGTAIASLDVAMTQRFSVLGRAAWAYERIGLAVPAGGGLLSDRRRSSVGYANLGVGWPIAARLTVKLQLDAHRSGFRSALGPLGRDAFQVSVGGTWELSSATALDLAVQENVRRDSVPDVAVQIGLAHRF